MSPSGWHPDLLALVAGALSVEAEAEAAAHLVACSECRDEEASLRSMRRSLRAAAAGVHVPPAELVDYDEQAGTLDGTTRSRVALHLFGCSDCRADLEALARARRAREAPGPAAGAGSGMPAVRAEGARGRAIAWRGLGAAAAALLLVGTALFALRRPPDRAPRPGASDGAGAAADFLPPTRGGAGPRVLAAGDAVVARIVLPYGAPGGAYRARIERADGTVAGRPDAAVVRDGEELAVRLEVPPVPGDYRLVLEPAAAPAQEPFVYPFRVAAGAAPR